MERSHRGDQSIAVVAEAQRDADEVGVLELGRAQRAFQGEVQGAFGVARGLQRGCDDEDGPWRRGFDSGRKRLGRRARERDGRVVLLRRAVRETPNPKLRERAEGTHVSA